MRTQHILIAAASAVGVASMLTTVYPCTPNALDAAGRTACNQFVSTGIVVEPKSRAKVATTVNDLAANSATPGIPAAGATLRRASLGDDSAWADGLNRFTDTCLEAGWSGP